MRRQLALAAVAGALCLGGVDEAGAAGPFCITMNRFCDVIEISTAQAGVNTYVYGKWDVSCDGELAPVMGWKHGLSFGGRPTFEGLPSGFTATFVLSDGLLDLAISDGVTFVDLVMDQQPYTITPGNCLPPVRANGKPPALSLFAR